MKKFIAFQRHSLTPEQLNEITQIGFTAETREVLLSSDSNIIGKMLEDAGLELGDGMTFVAPPIIAIRLTAVAKEKGIRVYLSEAKSNPAARKRTPFPASLTPDVKEFLKATLSNAVEETADGLVALGQAPFLHVKYVEV